MIEKIFFCKDILCQLGGGRQAVKILRTLTSTQTKKDKENNPKHDEEKKHDEENIAKKRLTERCPIPYFYVMQLQALRLFHFSLTLAVQFLKCFTLKICTMISEKKSCI